MIIRAAIKHLNVWPAHNVTTYISDCNEMRGLMLRQLSYAIKNQLKAPKAPY